VVEHFWPQLLMLALCHPGCFTAGEILKSIPGAGVAGVPDEYPDEREPLRDAYRRPDEGCYKIAGADWRGFQDFVELITSALCSVIESQSWNLDQLEEAARLYLRWRLTDRPELNQWQDPDQYNEVVLHYVMALEKIAIVANEKRHVTERLAERIGHLVGRDDSEMRGVRKFVRSAYMERSRVVHGRRRKLVRSR